MKSKVWIKGSFLGVLCFVMLAYGTVLKAQEPIPIGILGPFTGSLAFNAEEMKKGMMLAVDEVNAKGRHLRKKSGTDLRRYGGQTG